MADYIAMGGSPARVGKSGSRRDTQLEGKVLELLAALMGGSKAGKEDVRRLILSSFECSFLYLKPQSCVVSKCIFHTLETTSRDLMGFVQA